MNKFLHFFSYLYWFIEFLLQVRHLSEDMHHCIQTWPWLSGVGTLRINFIGRKLRPTGESDSFKVVQLGRDAAGCLDLDLEILQYHSGTFHKTFF